MRLTKAGTTANFAAAGSGTPDTRLISNKAVAIVRVHAAKAKVKVKHHRKRKRPHHFVACSARAPRAHAAC
jgi:hypothetical protein